MGKRPSKRPSDKSPNTSTNTFTLREHESIQVNSPDGTQLLQIKQTERGPKVTLLHDTASIDLKKTNLEINAQSITLNANEGDIDVTAKGNVLVEGTEIHLN